MTENLPHIAKKTEKSNFWSWAKVTNTLQRYDPGTKSVRHKIDCMFGQGAFKTLRYYETPDGEKARTAEIKL